MESELSGGGYGIGVVCGKINDKDSLPSFHESL